jgi:Ca2+-transporting ATPase
LPLLLWKFTDIFSPVHVIFLELIMGPTCSIIYENEPMEPGTMLRPPRKMGSNFLSLKQLTLSIMQGLMITLGCLGLGYYYIQQGQDSSIVRTIIFITLLFSNIFLTLENRSFRYSIFKTLRYKNRLVPVIIFTTLLFIAALLYVPFVQNLFMLHNISLTDIGYCAAVALASTGWLEIWKFFRKKSDTGIMQ